jgi:hypothetical protein
MDMTRKNSPVDIDIFMNMAHQSTGGHLRDLFYFFCVADKEPFSSYLPDSPRIIVTSSEMGGRPINTNFINQPVIPILASKRYANNFSAWQWDELCYTASAKQRGYKAKFKQRKDLDKLILMAHKHKKFFDEDFSIYKLINYPLVFKLMETFVSQLDESAKMLFCDKESPLQILMSVKNFLNQICNVANGNTSARVDYFCESRFMSYCVFGEVKTKFTHDEPANFYDKKALDDAILKFKSSLNVAVQSVAIDEINLLDSVGLL